MGQALDKGVYTPYSRTMNIRGQVQGFAIGAAVMAAVMLGAPSVLNATQSHPHSADEIAATFGVKIVWSVLPCKIALPTETEGCFLPDTPNVIYVDPASQGELRLHQTVLHELGHVVQQRLGIKRSECGADRFAMSLGSIGGNHKCGVITY